MHFMDFETFLVKTWIQIYKLVNSIHYLHKQIRIHWAGSHSCSNQSWFVYKSGQSWPEISLFIHLPFIGSNQKYNALKIGTVKNVKFGFH